MKPDIPACCHGVTGIKASLGGTSQIGVPDGFIIELQQAKLDTFGQWAFCCAFCCAGDPSGMDDTPVKEQKHQFDEAQCRELSQVLTAKAVAVRLLIGRDVAPQEMVLCRRLYFESRTYAVSDMHARIDHSADDRPGAMPLAERMARIEKQKTALVDVTWTAELEPAHKLGTLGFHSTSKVH